VKTYSLSDRPMRRVLVAGGAGFIGSHLCARLLGEGYAVLCVDNLSTGRFDNIAEVAGVDGFEFLHADVAEPFDICGPVDAVVNLASPASPADYLRAPVETLRAGSAGSFALLELARTHDARFVYASTSEIYGDPLIHPQPEGYWGNVNPVGPRSVYDESKRFGESVCAAYRREFGLNSCIVRIFNTYGPRMRRDDGRLVPNLITMALAGEPLPIYGDGTQTRSLCYVDDTVDAFVRLIETEIAGPVNVGSPVEHSVLEIANLIRELSDTTGPMDFGPAMVDDPQRRCPDIGTAERELGWKPEVDIREGIRRTIAYFSDTQSLSG
jgi:dTDP-glucose 4,6-dehydratase